MNCAECGQPVPEGGGNCPSCGDPLPPPAPNDEAPDDIAASSHPPAGSAGYAGFWRRAVALVTDSLVLTIVGISLGLIPAMAVPGDSDAVAANGRVAVTVATCGLLAWVYYAAMESSGWQATLGKLVIGLKVTDRTGARIGFGRATGRFFAKFLSCATMGLGFLIAAFTARRQALHDLLAETLVVR